MASFNNSRKRQNRLSSGASRELAEDPIEDVWEPATTRQRRGNHSQHVVRGELVDDPIEDVDDSLAHRPRQPARLSFTRGTASSSMTSTSRYPPLISTNPVVESPPSLADERKSLKREHASDALSDLPGPASHPSPHGPLSFSQQHRPPSSSLQSVHAPDFSSSPSDERSLSLGRSSTAQHFQAFSSLQHQDEPHPLPSHTHFLPLQDQGASSRSRSASFTAASISLDLVTPSSYAVPQNIATTSSASTSAPHSGADLDRVAWERLNKSKRLSDPDSSIASTHRFSRPLSWFAKQPRFGTGVFYRENDEHEIYGDENKRKHKPGSVERRTRDASRFSIKALSELDTRKLSANAQSQGHANRENLAFLQRERDLGDGTSFSPALIRTNMHGYQSRGVALEPLYKGRLLKRNIDGKVVEQQPLKKERDSPVEWQGGTFPDWVAQRRDDGKLIAFDLKVPRMAPVAYLEKTIHGTVSATYYDDIKHEIAKRRQQMPEGTEQRLVFDLISGGHDYKASRSALAEFAAEKGDFPDDSVQFLYRKKSGVVKMSKPILREHLSGFANKRKVVSDFKKTNK